jgi:predicted metal-dependent hydrolase
MITELNIAGVSVDVVFKGIQNVHLSVHPPTGRVRIAAPARMKMEAVRVFAISKLGWIRKQQTKLQAQERESPREYLERESHYLWGSRYLLRIIEGERPSGAASRHRTIVLTVPHRASTDKRRQILEAWYRAEMKAALEPLISKWEKRLGVRVERAFIQKMKTKWGAAIHTCATSGSILSWRRNRPDALTTSFFTRCCTFSFPITANGSLLSWIIICRSGVLSGRH